MTDDYADACVKPSSLDFRDLRIARPHDALTQARSNRYSQGR
jgi:hypothetical protein